MKLEQTLAIWPAPENFAAIAGYYREALADVPEDLVDEALREVRLTLKWFPKPSELRAPIREALARRHNRLYRLEREARSHAPPVRHEPPSVEEKTRVAALLRELRQTLQSGGTARDWKPWR